MSQLMRRPHTHESGDYYKGYINKVPSEDILQVLKNNLNHSCKLLENLPLEKWDYRYAPGKWSIKELMIHILDAERVFAYRALRIARNDQTGLMGFDQDDYIPFSGATNRSPQSIIEEFKALRLSTIALFENFELEMWGRMGTASDSPVSSLALAFIIAGHELHHFDIIKERYI